MTYAERLAEFVRVTGHKPGEMNKISENVGNNEPVRSLDKGTFGSTARDAAGSETPSPARREPGDFCPCCYDPQLHRSTGMVLGTMCTVCDGTGYRLPPPETGGGPTGDKVCSCGVGRVFLDGKGPCSCDCGNPACYLCVAKRNPLERVSLEPASQSAGPGRCNRFTRMTSFGSRAVAIGDPTPCKLPANHEGPHEP